MASSSAGLSHFVKDSVTCSVCLELFQCPKYLPCHHTFCLRCLEQLIAARKGDGVGAVSMACPLCNAKFQVTRAGLRALPDDFKTNSLVEVWRSNISKTSPCQVHPEHPYELYCLDCRTNICMKCAVLEQHAHHKQREIEKVAAEFSQRVENDNEAVNLHRTEARSNVRQLESERVKFVLKVEAAKVGVKKTAEELKKLVDTRANRLISELDSIQIDFCDELLNRKERLESEISKMDSFTEQCTHLKASSKSCDVTLQADQLRFHAKELLQTDVTLGNHQKHFVAFVPMDLNEITSRADFVGKVGYSYRQEN